MSSTSSSPDVVACHVIDMNIGSYLSEISAPNLR
jgi:hypothetical protein